MRLTSACSPLRPGLLLCGVALTTIAGCTGDRLGALGDRITARVADSGAEMVGVYLKDLVTGDSLLLAADVRVHAASMMKVPVMIQLFRDQEAGLSSLDDSLTITRSFESIVDGSPYELSARDDSDTTLYRRIGERESVRRLCELMITVSSNLATNMLIERVGADRVTATMREVGADSIEVLRGVEDTQAYRAGLSNTTTARDLGVIFSAIAEGRAVGGALGRQMVEILLRQDFNAKIPAGLPSGVRVAHKTGWISDYVSHDGGIVYLDDGGVYVLVVLTKGGEGHDDYADELIADISRMVYDAVRSSAEVDERHRSRSNRSGSPSIQVVFVGRDWAPGSAAQLPSVSM
jgi:beta-lactamase class A